jgi:hypothetical protein
LFEQRAYFQISAGKHNADASTGEALTRGQHGGQRYRA